MKQFKGTFMMGCFVFGLCLFSTLSLFGGMLKPSEVDSLATTTLQEWDIPGLAVAIVHHDTTFSRGYGNRERDANLPVNDETVFQIASLSKAFTGAIVGQLVEKKILEWEKPVVTYLPSFQLNDAVAQQEMTLRDLLSHRTGLPGISKGCWWLWAHTGRSSDELMKRLAFAEPAYPFRSHFSYNNVAYLVAGRVAEKATGSSWESLIQQRIFTPLHMTRTNISYEKLRQDRNSAKPHFTRSIQNGPIPWESWDALRPAGGINSCAKDLTSWLKYCLQGHSSVVDTLEAQTLVEPEGFLSPEQMSCWNIYVHDQPIVAYGFGWFMYTLKGKTIFFHSGLVDGMQSMCAIVPSENLGIAVMTNQSGHLGHPCLVNLLLDRMLNLPSVAWHEKGHKAISEMLQKAKEIQESIEKQVQAFQGSVSSTTYVGQYEHPAYGVVVIREEQGRLWADFWDHSSIPLRPYDMNQFAAFDASALIPFIITFEKNRASTKASCLRIPNLGQFDAK